jgi:outer membrane protein assembly factor BamB
VDGELLYALGSDGDLVCLQTATGKPLWRKSLRTDFGGVPGKWAYAESPLIDGDVLVCTPGGKDATLVALNKKTGALLWKCPVPGGDEADYASAVVSEAGGVRQYVQFLRKGVAGVEARSGKFLWRYDRTAKGSPANISTPIAKGDYVYSASRRGGAGLIRLKADGGAFKWEQVYFTPRLPVSIGGAVLLDGHLYGTNAEGLVCAEFTAGKIRWQDPCIGPASVCYADGCLYLHGEDGRVALVDATAAEYRERGRFAPPGQPKHPRGMSEKAWAYPVVANGRLYVRDLGVLWCYDVRDSKTAK